MNLELLVSANRTKKALCIENLDETYNLYVRSALGVLTINVTLKKQIVFLCCLVENINVLSNTQIFDDSRPLQTIIKTKKNEQRGEDGFD